MLHGRIDSRYSKIFLLMIAGVVLRATNDLEMFGFLTHPTLSMIDGYGGFDNNVIYAILHEQIYCQGCVSAQFCH